MNARNAATCGIYPVSQIKYVTVYLLAMWLHVDQKRMGLNDHISGHDPLMESQQLDKRIRRWTVMH